MATGLVLRYGLFFCKLIYNLPLQPEEPVGASGWCGEAGVARVAGEAGVNRSE